jgi:hypothetical protein
MNDQRKTTGQRAFEAFHRSYVRPDLKDWTNIDEDERARWEEIGIPYPPPPPPPPPAAPPPAPEQS